MNDRDEAIGWIAELIAPALRWNASEERYQ
jgi:hypothetical protein